MHPCVAAHKTVSSFVGMLTNAARAFTVHGQQCIKQHAPYHGTCFLSGSINCSVSLLKLVWPTWHGAICGTLTMPVTPHPWPCHLWHPDRACPGDAEANLVHAYMTAPKRGSPAWLERRLGEVLPYLPAELQPHVMIACAELRCWQQVDNSKGMSCLC